MQQMLLIGHNNFFAASTDFLAEGSVCLLPLDEGAPAQLPVSKMGLSGCCVLHPVTNVVQELGTASHLAVGVAKEQH